MLVQQALLRTLTLSLWPNLICLATGRTTLFITLDLLSDTALFLPLCGDE